MRAKTEIGSSTQAELFADMDYNDLQEAACHDISDNEGQRTPAQSFASVHGCCNNYPNIELFGFCEYNIVCILNFKPTLSTDSKGVLCALAEYAKHVLMNFDPWRDQSLLD